MRKLKHIDSIHNNWTDPFVEQLNFKIIDNKYLMAPKDIWDGGVFFYLLSNDLSLAVVDYVAKKEIEFVKVSAKSDFWYLLYDLSDGPNNHTLNNIKYVVGKDANFNFGFLDGVSERKVFPNIGTRTYSFRIVIRKSYFNELLKQYDLGSFNNRIQESIVDVGHFYGYADSTSKIIFNQIINKKFGDSNYELTIKSAAYKLLGIFFKNLVRINSFILKHPKSDLDIIINTKKYIDDNLHEAFQGIEFLASKSGMSQTKFKSNFKDFYGVTPALYYKKEKLNFAKTLLLAKKYTSIKDLCYDLDYGSPYTFIYLFKKEFGVAPHDLCN